MDGALVGKELLGDNAAAGALVAEEFPQVDGDKFSEGGGKGFVCGCGRFGEVKGFLEEESWVGERDFVGLL